MTALSNNLQQLVSYFLVTYISRSCFGMIGTMKRCLWSSSSPNLLCANLKSYLWEIKDSTILLSKSAKYWPRQFLGPSINGKNVNGAGLEVMSVNLVGSKVFGLGQYFSFWWTLWILIVILDPLGIIWFPIFVGLTICLITTGTTEYKRSASFKQASEKTNSDNSSREGSFNSSKLPFNQSLWSNTFPASVSTY